MFLSPAVTPWKSTLPGVGYNNPSLRLYKYDKTTSQVLDYYQYYLNLTEANSKQGERIFYVSSKMSSGYFTNQQDTFYMSFDFCL